MSMLQHVQPMTWLSSPALAVVSALLSASLAACTKPNPRDCSDGNCNDPAFPFCDVGGEINHVPLTCIAVDCKPNTFAACRGDTELACNATGTDYDNTQCVHGCAPGVGCQLCEENQTICTNGTLQTCDGNGAITSSEACALGCFEDQPRCRDIVPSNFLATYADSVANPPALELTNAIFDSATGQVTVNGQLVNIPTAVLPAVGNGAVIRVFAVQSLKLINATITAEPVTAAIALVAKGDIILSGTITVSSHVGSAIIGCNAGPGNYTLSASSGGGGGANATDGANGGALIGTGGTIGGFKDLVSGTSEIRPLRGGCSGGLANPPDSFANGGGAIQLTSGTSITVDATLDVRGHDGATDTSQGQSGGGGAGGSILIEAPRVVLSAQAKLLATGGNGGTRCATVNCGAGGTGATATTPATVGMDTAYKSTAIVTSAGGGGGGLGRVRINTMAGLYTKSDSTIVDAVLTTGTLETR